MSHHRPRLSHRPTRSSTPRPADSPSAAVPPSAPVAEDALSPEERALPAELQGCTLDLCLRQLFGLSWGEARDLVRRGKVTVDGVRRLDPRQAVRGERLRLDREAPRVRTVGELEEGSVLACEADFVVVHKPAGLLTIPFHGDEPDTLESRLRRWLETRPGAPRGRPSLGIVHRLDRETSGLLVFTRTWAAKQSLATQFRAHTVLRRYLALAHGHPSAATHSTHLLPDRGDGRRGSWERTPAARAGGRPHGDWAVTRVVTLEEAPEASLVECRLETGRTHQIRIHLAEAGHPVLGETVYLDDSLGPFLPAPRLLLHAAELGFTHPVTGREVRWECPPPADFQAVWERLRGRDRPGPRPSSSAAGG